MKTPRSESASQKLIGEIRLARILVAKAESQRKSAKEQARAAKRRRKEAKEAVRRAKKQARLAKTGLAEAKQSLAAAEMKLAQAAKRQTAATRRKQSTKPSVSKSTRRLQPKPVGRAISSENLPTDQFVPPAEEMPGGGAAELEKVVPSATPDSPVISEIFEQPSDTNPKANI